MKYEYLIHLVADLYEELNINEFGFDLEYTIKKLDINLIPYSVYEKNKEIFNKLDNDGFSLINPINSKIEIYYNDKIEPKERLKFTLAHELGHIILGHNLDSVNETDEIKKEADMFARIFYCSQAFMIKYKLITISDLISSFGITQGYAEVLLEKLGRRKNKKLSEAERRLIDVFEKNRLK